MCDFVFKIIVYLSVCLFGFVTHANDLKLHGFVAQGLIQSNESNFVNDDGDISTRLTEVGINASYRIHPKLRVAGQGIYLNGGNRYPEGARIDYLFLDWQLLNIPNWQVDMHIGRYKNYHWMYSATRDVPHTRPSIILPQSIYFDVFRDVALGSDGLAILASTNNEVGEWEINWSYGRSDISAEQTQNLLSDGASGDLEQDFAHQFTLTWKPITSLYQVGLSLLDSKFSYRQGQGDDYFDGVATSQRLMLNFIYFGEFWELSSEILKERVVFQDVVFPSFYSDSTAEGGYLQFRYFINPRVNALLRLDLFDRDRRDRSGREIEFMSNGNVPGYFGYMDQATLGIDWKVSEKVQLQVEYHRVKGTGRLAPVLSPNVQLNTGKYWDIWAVQLMYWF